MDTLTERFIRGIAEYNLTPEIIRLANWHYCGGENDLSYWRLEYGKKAMPEHKSQCVCGHKIKINCFITDGNSFLTLGSCCVKKFIPKSGRTCNICGNSHKNRIVNRCNECRVGVCDGCGKSCGKDYKKCYTCEFRI